MKFSKFNLIVTDEESGKIILFNTLHGNCIEIEEELKEHIESNLLTQLDMKTQEMFKQLVH